MLDYAHDVAVRKRVEPGDDLATTLVNAVVDGDRLTDDELQWFFLLLVNAGGDTTPTSSPPGSSCCSTIPTSAPG